MNWPKICYRALYLKKSFYVFFALTLSPILYLVSSTSGISDLLPLMIIPLAGIAAIYYHFEKKYFPYLDDLPITNNKLYFLKFILLQFFAYLTIGLLFLAYYIKGDEGFLTSFIHKSFHIYFFYTVFQVFFMHIMQYRQKSNHLKKYFSSYAIQIGTLILCIFFIAQTTYFNANVIHLYFSKENVLFLHFIFLVGYVAVSMIHNERILTNSSYFDWEGERYVTRAAIVLGLGIVSAVNFYVRPMVFLVGDNKDIIPFLKESLRKNNIKSFKYWYSRIDRPQEIKIGGAQLQSYAILTGKVELLQYLLSNRLVWNPNQKLQTIERHSFLPLALAIQSNSANMVKFVLAQGTPYKIIDSYGSSPLHYISFQCNQVIYEMIKEFDLDQNETNTLGHSPLGLSKHFGCPLLDNSITKREISSQIRPSLEKAASPYRINQFHNLPKQFLKTSTKWPQ